MLVNGHADVSDANSYVLAVLCGLEPDEPAWPSPDPMDGATTGGPYDALAGLYRSYNPWMSTVRVIAKHGVLVLADPVGGDASVLHRDGENTFRVGHPDSPEVAEFDIRVSDQCQRLMLSGCVYGRARRD
jgi:hypothetical protein